MGAGSLAGSGTSEAAHNPSVILALEDLGGELRCGSSGGTSHLWSVVSWISLVLSHI